MIVLVEEDRAEDDFWRRFAGTSKMEKSSKEILREIIEVEKTIIEEIERRMTCFGKIQKAMSFASRRLRRQKKLNIIQG